MSAEVGSDVHVGSEDLLAVIEALLPNGLWREGERLARLHGDEREIVGLGFLHLGSDGFSLNFIELQNVAVEPRHRFQVDGVSVQEAIRVAGHKPVVLWHSHTTKSGQVPTPDDGLPSDTDVQFFPSWLATVGIVYHTSLGSSVPYTEDGVISSMASPFVSLTSGDLVVSDGA